MSASLRLISFNLKAASLERQLRQAHTKKWSNYSPKKSFPNPSDEHINEDLLFGLHPVKGALTAGQRRFSRLYLKETSQGDEKISKKLDEILALAQSKKVPFKVVDKVSLNNLSKQNVNQGVVLAASPLEFKKIDKLEPPKDHSKQQLWVALDRVVDPINLGSVIRSCAFFGVDGIVVSEQSTAPLSPSVSKASSGALEFFPIHSTRYLQQFLRESKENGWQVIGTTLPDSNESSVNNHDDDDNTTTIEEEEQQQQQEQQQKHKKRVAFQSVENIKSQNKPVILVLGSEGRGLRINVLNECDALVSIKGSSKASEALVDSLNVNVAAALFLYQFLRE